MTYLHYLSKVWKIIFFDSKTISEISKDSKATKYSFLTAFLSAGLWILLTYLLSLVQRSIFDSLLFEFLIGEPYPIYSFSQQIQHFLVWIYPFSVIFIWLLLGSGIFWILAKILRGKGTYLQIVRPLGLAMGMYFLSSVYIPFTLFPLIIKLWLVATSISIVKTTQNVSTWKALIAVFFPIILLLLFTLVPFLLIVIGMAYSS